MRFLLWTGGADTTDWGTAGNWTAGVPVSGSDVCIGVTGGGYSVVVQNNPAVTVAFVCAGRMGTSEAIGYIASQVVGGVVGALLLVIILKGRLAGWDLGAEGLGQNGWGQGYLGGYGLLSAFLVEIFATFIFVAVILGIGFIVLRFTDAGLAVRAMVDSPAMTSLSGANPFRISLAVWMVSTFLAGVCGMLIAPIIGLSAASFTQLIAAAFAAVVAARLRNLGVAIALSFACPSIFTSTKTVRPRPIWSRRTVARYPSM